MTFTTKTWHPQKKFEQRGPKITGMTVTLMPMLTAVKQYVDSYPTKGGGGGLT